MTAVPAMTATLYQEVRAALLKQGRHDLLEQLAAFEPKELLTSTEAARVLGLSSPNTIKNWLAGGHWRIPRAEVEAVQARLEELRDRNRRGDLSLPDQDDDGSLPLL